MGALRGGVSLEADTDDLFSLCDVFAQRLDALVAIEDADFQVVAYSSGLAFGDEYRRQAILQRRTTAESLQRLTSSGLLARLRSTTDVIALDEDEFLPGARRRLLRGLHEDGGFVGVIWACADESDFAPHAGTLLAEMAELVAPSLARRRTAGAAGHDEAGRLLRRALEDSDPSALAVRWQLPDDATAVLLAGIEPASGQPPLASLVALLRAQTALRGGPTAVTCLGPAIFVATAVDGSGDHPVARARLARAAELTGTPLLTAMAGARPLTELTSAHNEVRRILRALRHPRAPATTAVLEDVRPLSTLLELADVVRERPHLQGGTAARMTEHDRDHGTAYVDTLRALLEEFGDVPAAAKRLCLHPNSYRYRLRRLQDLFEVDLADADARLVLQLQLRLADERTPTTPVTVLSAPPDPRPSAGTPPGSR